MIISEMSEEISMEERIEELEKRVYIIPCLENLLYSKEERIEELEYDTRELQEKVQKLENLIDKWQDLFFNLGTTKPD